MTAYTKSLAEGLSTSDALTRSTTFGRVPVESTGVSDAVTRFLSSGRTFIENAEGYGYLNSPMLLFTVPVLVSTSDGPIVRAVTTSRIITETYPTTDMVTRHGSFPRSLAETLTTADVLVEQHANYRTFSEALMVSDSVVRLPGFRRQFSENLTQFTGLPLLFMTRKLDVLTRIVGFGRGAPTSLTTSDVVLRGHVGFGRINAESLTTADSLLRRLIARRLDTEMLATSDAVARVPAYHRLDVEPLITIDAAYRGVGAHRSIGESWSIGGRASLPLLFTLPPYGAAYDIVTTYHAAPRLIIESLTTSDRITLVTILAWIMGYIWVNPTTGQAVASLPDWGYVLTEDPILGNVLNRGPIPTQSLNFSREK